jgi:hypothetical protein
MIACRQAGDVMDKLIRDRLWLWCHPPGSHTRSHEQHGLPGRSTITPAQAAAYLGISNILFVRYELEPQPPFEIHAQPLTTMKQVVWSIEGGGGGDVDAVLALTKKLPKLSGIILDDYFARVTATARMGIESSDFEMAEPDAAFSVDAIRGLRHRLRVDQHRLDIWVVLYAHELNWDAVLRPHLELCDVVTLWTWNAAELANLETNFNRFEQMVGDKRKVLGVYMWDYHAKQPMPVRLMEHQCSLGLRWLREGRIEGMIFLASCICDLGLEAVEWVREWIAQNHSL